MKKDAMVSKSNKIVVMGGGAFGVALAKLLSEKSREVTLWARDEKICQAINETHHHPTRLSQITLLHHVVATTDLRQALCDARFVVLALPMAALRSVLDSAKAYFHEGAIIVSTAKGIEEASWALPCDILKAVLPKNLSERACFLSGPSFALELALNLPAALTLASGNQESSLECQRQLSSPSFRLYRTDDVVGVCVGGALKNVIAIAAGACNGLSLGRNALAALITRGLFEITTLAVKMGGRAETVSGLSGAGDLILSCTDDMSRNHRLGRLLADGFALPKALQKIESVVEGRKTAESIPALSEKFQVELPISMAVYRVLYEQENVKSAVLSLLARKLHEEFTS
ncbi:MAG TPA: NAD(P)H-dependent glycerol-3-phosphate dehydrogenase [Myxococcota bacterium]|nr:NAD(P)H-dependent glycerol-3-phosphate dehydrogenase [Myxococcota bacterium]